MSFRNHNRILEVLEPYIEHLKPPSYFCSTVDNFVLFLHYRWSSVILLAYTSASLTGWYFVQDTAICVNKFDRSPISSEMKDICMTYPFLVLENIEGKDVRHYALYYKWIPYAFGLALSFFIALQFFVRKIDDPKVQQFLSNLVSMTSRCERYVACERYFFENIGRHVHLSVSKMNAIMVCIAVNLIVVFVLNMTVAGFYFFVPLHLFVVREMRNFSDPISATFPPFVECELSPEMQLWMDRTETIGCYLPFMELYEKMFIGFWLWQAFLFCLGIGTLVFDQLPMYFPKHKRRLLVVPSRPEGAARLLAQKTSYGDVILLKKLQPLLTVHDFQLLLESIAHCIRELDETEPLVP